MKLQHPQSVAQQVAALLESDPIAAAQVKEHLKPQRLLELLDLPVEDILYFIGPLEDLPLSDGPEDEDDEEDEDVRA